MGERFPSDETLERIAIALEKIATSLEKIVNPLLTIEADSHAPHCSQPDE